MAIEIERKFLVRDDSWRTEVVASLTMRQGYLAGGHASSVRVRVSGDRAYLNIKSATLGIRRQEYEYGIPVNDADEMLNSLCRRPLIEKVRHHVRHQGWLWEIDEFSGANAGLIVAEIELRTEQESFAVPSWCGDDVSHDRRYYNVSLVEHPYSSWSTADKDGKHPDQNA